MVPWFLDHSLSLSLARSGVGRTLQLDMGRNLRKPWIFISAPPQSMWQREALLQTCCFEFQPTPNLSRTWEKNDGIYHSLQGLCVKNLMTLSNWAASRHTLSMWRRPSASLLDLRATSRNLFAVSLRFAAVALLQAAKATPKLGRAKVLESLKYMHRNIEYCTILYLLYGLICLITDHCKYVWNEC